MLLLTYGLAALAFCAAFLLIRLIPACARALVSALGAVEALADHTRSDVDKARAARRAALRMLVSAGEITLKAAGVIAAAVAPVAVADALGWATYAEVGAFAARLDALLITTAIALLAWWILARRPVDKPAVDYAPLDRALHNLAFGVKRLQRLLVGLERRLFARRWSAVEVRAPIFITSLPRAGTTILLEALHRLPTVATHTYRDMPFILTPVLWGRASGLLRGDGGALKERAHGDGIQINEDSPEALEEALWLRFFPQKYRGDRIGLWSKADAQFTRFLTTHMRQIILLRRPEALERARYVSKNNGNISRIPALRAMYPDAHVLIPLRDPLEHAISMLRQHENFLEQQERDPFVGKYMADIGHFDFGASHKPIRFEGLEGLIEGRDPTQIDYWIAYWIAAFEHLAAQEGVDFLSYAGLTTSGAEGLGRLCRRLGLEASDAEIAAAASIFRAPPPKRVDQFTPDEELAARAWRLYEDMRARCVLKTQGGEA